MKKRMSMIAAALASVIVLSMSVSPVTTMAATKSEQYVTVEDGVTVVYITTYVDPDEFISEQVVTWYDANGTKFVNTVKPRKEQSLPDISSKVTWTDGSGNTYVLDQASNTVTIYDSTGNVIAVKPAN